MRPMGCGMSAHESSPRPPRRHPQRVSVHDLSDAKAAGRRWAMATCYDAPTAALLEAAGVPVLLVGDSAAVVVLWHESTRRITLEEMAMLTSGVVRGASGALVVADMPFGSYEQGAAQAVESAARLVGGAGARAVKMEGGARIAEQVAAVTAMGVPVFAHVGLAEHLLPFHVGFTPGTETVDSRKKVLADALLLVQAGAAVVVCEQMPQELVGELASATRVPVVAIGPCPEADAELMVSVDLLGMPVPGRSPKSDTAYAQVGDVIRRAAEQWVAAVAGG